MATATETEVARYDRVRPHHASRAGQIESDDMDIVEKNDMYRILKWEIPILSDEVEVGSGEVVHVDIQGDNSNNIMLWTLEKDREDVEGEAVEVREVSAYATVVGTGQYFDGWMYSVAGTAVDKSRGFVWHVLRRRVIE